jgi:hypothetical protein
MQSRSPNAIFLRVDAETEDGLFTIAQSKTRKETEVECETRLNFMTVSSRRKHIHHWNKSLAGGFRCACEAWRCEFAEGTQQCEIASEQG